VFAEDEDRSLEVLDEAECLALLHTAVIGRVAFTEGALPAIQPVSFRLQDGHVLIPTRPGSKVAAASRGAVLAFAVDDVRVADRTGWDVTVVGPARVISEPRDVAALDHADGHGWPDAGARCYVAISVQLVHGRRVGLRLDAGDLGA
jgi:nitroimidazol reductase NimA-like FMN-containing flavoprotein (pyridoxamine 5'-phosphate oxidase superfamily)